MTIYPVNFIALSDLNTSNWGAISDASGGSWSIGSDWINFSTGASIDTISVSDDDGGFGDDDFSQSLAGGAGLNGQWFGNGTMVENEYMLTVQDSLGKTYQLAALSVQNEAYNVRGFVYVGYQPPLGENLTIVAVEDSANLSYTPTCFTPGTRIRTPAGEVPIEALQPGDPVITLDAGAQPVQLVLRRRLQPVAGAGPVRIASGSLGPGLPRRPLTVSPQHRILIRNGGREWLVPAKALPVARNVDMDEVTYIHLVMNGHHLVTAEGIACESFWPGETALASLAPVARLAIIAAMPDPHPARPFLRPGAYRRRLARQEAR